MTGVRHTVRASVGALLLAEAGVSVEVSALDGVGDLASLEGGVRVLAAAGIIPSGDGRKFFHEK